MSDDELVLYRRQGSIARLTLNRPERLTRISHEGSVLALRGPRGA